MARRDFVAKRISMVMRETGKFIICAVVLTFATTIHSAQESVDVETDEQSIPLRTIEEIRVIGLKTDHTLRLDNRNTEKNAPTAESIPASRLL